jgi:putative peptidoglycan lipid II flippase
LIILTSAKLESHGNYLLTSWNVIPLNLVQIIYLAFFSASFGIIGFTIAFVIGTLLQLLVLLPGSRKLGYHPSINLDYKNEGFEKVRWMIFPIIIGSAIQNLNILIDRFLASGLAEGSISVLNYASRLSYFLVGIFTAVIATLFFNSASKYFSVGNLTQFKLIIQKGTVFLTIFIVPAFVGMMLLSKPIIQVVYQRGTFDAADTLVTSSALFFYSFGIIGFTLRELFAKALYSMKDTKTPMINGAIAIVINIIVSLSLVPYLGVGGIALGTSVSGVTSAVLLYLSFRIKLKGIKTDPIRTSMVKIIFASSVMGVVVWGFFYGNVFQLPLLFLFGLTVLLGVGIYVGILFLSKIPEVEDGLNMLKQQIQRVMK